MLLLDDNGETVYTKEDTFNDCILYVLLLRSTLRATRLLFVCRACNILMRLIVWYSACIYIYIFIVGRYLIDEMSSSDNKVCYKIAARIKLSMYHTNSSSFIYTYNICSQTISQTILCILERPFIFRLTHDIPSIYASSFSTRAKAILSLSLPPELFRCIKIQKSPLVPALSNLQHRPAKARPLHVVVVNSPI